MSAPVVDRPVTDAELASAAPSRSDRRWTMVLVAGVLSTLAGGAIIAMQLLAGPTVVRPVFEDGAAVETEFGDEATNGRPGSWIVTYVDGTSTTMRVPWDGGEVASARLSTAKLDLATIADASVDGDELVLTIALDGCDYFHEREMQIFPTMDVVTTAGDDVVLTFDRPLFVRSPMLWQCPDRLIDRQAKLRSDL